MHWKLPDDSPPRRSLVGPGRGRFMHPRCDTDKGRRQRRLSGHNAREVRTHRGAVPRRGELTYDHAARRCSIEGRGIDGRGASRANASGAVEASGTDTTVLKVEGNFNGRRAA
jgi:hypothetical protein